MLTAMAPSVLIREARRGARLTQVQLAERAGTTQPEVARLERGGGNPTLATVERVLRATGHELELRAVPVPVSPVDESQIVELLRLSPAERLETFTASKRNLDGLVAGARRTSRG
jgi:predicted transcriptional regulator